MQFPTTSVRSRRFVGGSVAALLTANAFAFATLVNDDAPSDGRFRDVEPAAIPEIPPSAPVELALITTTDGRTFTVDPSTPEGRRAIRDARREGATVRELAVPGSGETEAVPATGEEKLLGQPGLLDPVPDGGGEIGGLTGIIRAVPSTLTSVVDGVGATVSTLVPTVSSVVGDVDSTVSSVVGGVGSTVSSLVGGFTPTTAAPSGSTPTTAPSLVGGLLGGLESVVTTVVGVAESETTAASPTPDPVCTLLVFCH